MQFLSEFHLIFRKIWRNLGKNFIQILKEFHATVPRISRFYQFLRELH